jgi:hypothetical protein
MRSWRLLAIAALCACASSGTSGSAKLIDVWRAPGTVSFVFNKIAVLALNGGPDVRAQVEGLVAARDPRLTAASSVLGKEDMRGIEAIKRKLLAANFDGVIVMRLIREGEINPHASKPGESISSYANSVSPGEVPFGGKLQIETTVYRVEDEGMIWKATVESDTSADRQTAIRDAVQVMSDHLRETGIIH